MVIQVFNPPVRDLRFVVNMQKYKLRPLRVATDTLAGYYYKALAPIGAIIIHNAR